MSKTLARRWCAKKGFEFHAFNKWGCWFHRWASRGVWTTGLEDIKTMKKDLRRSQFCKKIRHRLKHWIFNVAQHVYSFAGWLEEFARPCEWHRWYEMSGGTHAAQMRCRICTADRTKVFKPPREMLRGKS